MSDYSKADQTLNSATDKASAALKGVNFSDTNKVLDEFNAKIDQASEEASAKYKNTKM